MQTTFKIILLGDGGCGKTTFINRHLTGEFEQKYVATLGVEVKIMNINTNKGLITLNIWDTAGQEKLGGLRDGYYINADGALLFFDKTSLISYQNTSSLYQTLVNITDTIPVVLVGNKADIPDLKVKPSQIVLHTQVPNMQYCMISTKSGYNIDIPILMLLKKLMNNSNLYIVD